jgi:alpha-D-ribose 1-methylphosphonate 5-triphosphate synthase subunit PhnI
LREAKLPEETLSFRFYRSGAGRRRVEKSPRRWLRGTGLVFVDRLRKMAMVVLHRKLQSCNRYKRSSQPPQGESTVPATTDFSDSLEMGIPRKSHHKGPRQDV